MGSKNQQTSLRSPGDSVVNEVLEGTTPRGSLTQWGVACVNDAMGLSQRSQILNHGQPYRFIKVDSMCSWPFLRYATVLRQSHKSYWFYSCWIPKTKIRVNGCCSPRSCLFNGPRWSTGKINCRQRMTRCWRPGFMDGYEVRVQRSWKGQSSLVVLNVFELSTLVSKIVWTYL